MEVRGSQIRERIEDSEYTVVRIANGEAVVVDGDGKRELYAANNDFAGHVLVIDGIGYEFVTSF